MQVFVSKPIVTSDGENEFQIRYIRDEGVGVATTRTDKSYFMLDSADYWYDLIQEKYPPVMKCSCKNDFFSISFNYVRREDTEDFKEINIICKCTACNKEKKLPPVKIDYSPSCQLFDNPISFCKQPKIKYKTFSPSGYWTEKAVLSIADFFVKRNLFIYCWYWDSQKRFFKEITAAELHTFLTEKDKKYNAVYFSEEPLDDDSLQPSYDEKGVYVKRDLWRKKRVFKLNSPFMVVPCGLFYSMEFCSEYIDNDGKVIEKDASFSELVQEFNKFCKNPEKQTQLHLLSDYI